MEDMPISQDQLYANEFKKLRRTWQALSRQGIEMDQGLIDHMFSLDDWLTENTEYWHRNFNHEDAWDK